ncbi:hypothetical protein BKD09_33075 [Bradyrhizobium japonicum]|uniref:Uncharacterized protein n=1 Tax=Bradyrhizobium japonicum TaxID=375 RepID=A0A1L3FIS8_BRAJP|nr:hypothetical protein BKD09_33075 [Bradyrhizobium japonicum]
MPPGATRSAVSPWQDRPAWQDLPAWQDRPATLSWSPSSQGVCSEVAAPAPLYLLC